MAETLGEHLDEKAELEKNHPELYKLLNDLVENGTKKELRTVFDIVNMELWRR